MKKTKTIWHTSPKILRWCVPASLLQVNFINFHQLGPGGRLRFCFWWWMSRRRKIRQIRRSRATIAILWKSENYLIQTTNINVHFKVSGKGGKYLSQGEECLANDAILHIMSCANNIQKTWRRNWQKWDKGWLNMSDVICKIRQDLGVRWINQNRGKLG